MVKIDTIVFIIFVGIAVTRWANRELKNEVSNLEDRYTVPSTVREGG